MTTTDYKERQKEVAKENFIHHREVKAEALSSIDNVIFVVSTGAFGISVGTIAYFQAPISYFQVSLLMLSWIFLFFSIISMVVSNTFDAHHSRLNMDKLGIFITSNYTVPSPEWNMNINDDPKISRAASICAFARLFSIIFLIVGSLTLLIFGGSLLLSKTSSSSTLNSPTGQKIASN